MTASDNSKDDDERLMGEWMKVMLGELERKRDEHDEAVAEDRLRGGSDAPASASARQDGGPESDGNLTRGDSVRSRTAKRGSRKRK